MRILFRNVPEQEKESIIQEKDNQMRIFCWWCDTKFSNMFRKEDFADETRFRAIRSSLIKLSIDLYPPTGRRGDLDIALMVYDKLVTLARSLCKDDFATEPTEEK